MQNFIEKITPWILNHGIKIIIIIAGAHIVKRLMIMLTEKFIRKIIVRNRYMSKETERKRENTLIHILTWTFKILIWIIAVLMILSEIGIEVGPLLAAAGVAGLAFGFGGQYLIRDIITGLFIIMENQYQIGDVVCFDGTCGVVEEISLRMTILRDLDGNVHTVPHGEIKKVTNMSKKFARINLNIGISYNSNLEKVIKVVDKIGKEMAKDKTWKKHIIKPPRFLRVDDFADSAIIIKILGKVKPLQQWAVAGELRKRLKINFDKEGIEIPFPQRVVHQAKK